MPVSEKQKKYAEKYIRSTFDEIKLRVPKGKKEVIKDFAAMQGESLNGFVNIAIDEKMEREREEVDGIETFKPDYDVDEYPFGR